MKPDSYAWPPPREIRNVAPGRRMAELSTTAAKRCWSPDDDDAPPAPPPVKRWQMYVAERHRNAVLDLLTQARDTGTPLTRCQIRLRLRLDERAVAKVLHDLLAEKLVVRAGQSAKLANNKTADTFRAAHAGEDEPLLTEPPTLAEQLKPHLVRARDLGCGITRAELVKATKAAWSSVGNTLQRMRTSGHVQIVGEALREGGATNGGIPKLYAATRKL